MGWWCPPHQLGNDIRSEEVANEAGERPCLNSKFTLNKNSNWDSSAVFMKQIYPWHKDSYYGKKMHISNGLNSCTNCHPWDRWTADSQDTWCYWANYVLYVVYTKIKHTIYCSGKCLCPLLEAYSTNLCYSTFQCVVWRRLETYVRC